MVGLSVVEACVSCRATTIDESKVEPRPPVGIENGCCGVAADMCCGRASVPAARFIKRGVFRDRAAARRADEAAV